MSKENSASRPKIHRLPSHRIQEGELYVSRAVLIMCFALLLVAVIPALWSLYHTYRQPPADHPSVLPKPAIIHASAASPHIKVSDVEGVLAGILVKMPNDLEHGATIHSTSQNDPQSGKDLMNIIGNDRP